MAALPLHILFHPSGGGHLRRALEEAGRPDQVVCLFDRFDIGPIKPSDPDIRCKWVEDELGYTNWDEVITKSMPFWDRALSPEGEKIAWMSRRDVIEYSGFLEWLWRFGDAPFKLVDVTDVTLASERVTSRVPDLAISVARIPAWRMLELGLLDRSEEVAPALRKQYRQLWERLRDENAPIRVLSDGTLSSSSMSHFDTVLMAEATTRWRKAAMVIMRALAALDESRLRQTDDLVLAARIRALCNQGQLHGVGDLFEVSHSEVRLPVENADEEPESCEIPESIWPMTPSDKPPQA